MMAPLVTTVLIGHAAVAVAKPNTPALMFICISIMPKSAHYVDVTINTISAE